MTKSFSICKDCSYKPKDEADLRKHSLDTGHTIMSKGAQLRARLQKLALLDIPIGSHIKYKNPENGESGEGTFQMHHMNQRDIFISEKGKTKIINGDHVYHVTPGTGIKGFTKQARMRLEKIASKQPNGNLIQPHQRLNPDVALKKEVPFGKENRTRKQMNKDTVDRISHGMDYVMDDKKLRPDKPKQRDRTRIITAKQRLQKVAFTDEEEEQAEHDINRSIEEEEAENTGKKIRPRTPTDKDFQRIISAKIDSAYSRIVAAKMTEARGRIEEIKLAKEHNHQFVVTYGVKDPLVKTAQLVESENKNYLKYWLLNAKQTNGNGWGVDPSTIDKNIRNFEGMPFVVTAQSWHENSPYLDQYVHPYIPTNNLRQIFAHQERFRVGTIRRIIKDADQNYYAQIEKLPRFAHMANPPFCSPGIFQLDPRENQQHLTKWLPLHLAGLMQDPAYGPYIATLKGSCVGTENECHVQFSQQKYAQLLASGDFDCPYCDETFETKSLKINHVAAKHSNDTSKTASLVCPIKVASARDKLQKLSIKYPEADDELFKTDKQRDSEKQELDEADHRLKNELSKKLGFEYYKIRPPTPTQKDRIKTMKAQLQQIDQQLTASVEDVVKSFKAKKAAKSGNHSTNGKSYFLFNKEIARHTRKGMEVGNAGYDTPSTYNALKSIGIKARTTGGKTFINEKPYMHGTFVTVPYKDVSDTPAFSEATLNKRNEIKTKKTVDANYHRQYSDQARKRANFRDETAIQPEHQEEINKITGVKSPIPKETIGTQVHHIIPKIQAPGLKFNPNNAVVLSTPNHKEIHKLNPELKKKLTARLQKVASELGEENMTYQGSKKTKLKKKLTKIAREFYEPKEPEQESPLRKRFMQVKKQMEANPDIKPDPEQISDYVKSGKPFNPSKTAYKFNKDKYSKDDYADPEKARREDKIGEYAGKHPALNNEEVLHRRDYIETGHKISPPKGDFSEEVQKKYALLQKTARYNVQEPENVKINPEHGAGIANAYGQMKHEPNNPEVKSSYDALINETKQQFKTLTNGGLKITPSNDQYKNSKEMHQDIEENNHLKYFPTEMGGDLPRDHPMAQDSGMKDPNGKPMLNNDVFRIVHDINGHHLAGKSGFGPRGEHQAYLQHSKMYSPLARRALFTETAGQNNYVNFGPNGEHNRKDPANTIYAPQKAGVMPDTVINGKHHIESTKMASQEKCRVNGCPNNKGSGFTGYCEEHKKQLDLSGFDE